MLPRTESKEMPAFGGAQEMFGEHPKSNTAPLPTTMLPPTDTVAGTAGVPVVGSPGATASSNAPGATVRLPQMLMLPAGM